MPPSKHLTLEEALSAIIDSIAKEEVALSHLITAEKEKIQYVIRCRDHIDDVLAVNNSVDEVLGKILAIQIILKEKLSLATKFIPKPPEPPKPPKPPHEPRQCEECITTPRHDFDFNC